jgi:hypothetical protein
MPNPEEDGLVDLFVQVSRDPDGRLNGNVVPRGSKMRRSFSGTLELLKVLEDFVIPATSSDQMNQGPQDTARRKP